MYFRSLLFLYKPWRIEEELKDEDQSFEDAWLAFVETSPMAEKAYKMKKDVARAQELIDQYTKEREDEEKEMADNKGDGEAHLIDDGEDVNEEGRYCHSIIPVCTFTMIFHTDFFGILVLCLLYVKSLLSRFCRGYPV